MALKDKELDFIARHLANERNVGPIAVIEDITARDTVLFARANEFDVSKYTGAGTAVDPQKRIGNPPFSPVVNLIQGLYLERGEAATPTLRGSFIRTNYLMHSMCSGMMDVVGAKGGSPALAVYSPIVSASSDESKQHGELLKRVKYVEMKNDRMDRLVPHRVSGLGPPPKGIDLESGSARSVHRIYMLAAMALASRRVDEQQPQAAPAGKNIAALLVSSKGAVLAVGMNSVDEHDDATCHAEVNLVQSHFLLNERKRIPVGARIYTTLKPCAMCAGMIMECSEDSSKNMTFYGQFDPGAGAIKTALTEAHRERPLSVSGAVHIPESHWRWLPYPMSEVMYHWKASAGDKDQLARLLKKDTKGIQLPDGNDLTALLDRLYKMQQDGTAAAWISGAGAKSLAQANDVLAKKVAKYQQNAAGNALVREAMDHIVPLLKARGVTLN